MEDRTQSVPETAANRDDETPLYQLCLTDPLTGEIVFRDPLAIPDTPKGMEYAQAVIRAFHKEAERRPRVLHNLGIFPWLPVHGRVYRD